MNHPQKIEKILRLIDQCAANHAEANNNAMEAVKLLTELEDDGGDVGEKARAIRTKLMFYGSNEMISYLPDNLTDVGRVAQKWLCTWDREKMEWVILGKS